MIFWSHFSKITDNLGWPIICASWVQIKKNWDDRRISIYLHSFNFWCSENHFRPRYGQQHSRMGSKNDLKKIFIYISTKNCVVGLSEVSKSNIFFFKLFKTSTESSFWRLAGSVIIFCDFFINISMNIDWCSNKPKMTQSNKNFPCFKIL